MADFLIVDENKHNDNWHTEKHNQEPLIQRINNALLSMQKINTKDKAVFYRLLATMTNAGMSLMKSVSVLRSQEKNKVFKSILEKIEVDLGGVRCIIEHIGGDHSSDSNLVYIKGEKFMFLGDSIYRDLNKEHKCYHIEVIKPLIEKIMAYDTDYYLTSHKPVYTKVEMKAHFDSMIDIGEFVGDRVDLKQLTIDYGEKKGNKTTAQERFLIGSFVNGNKNKL